MCGIFGHTINNQYSQSKSIEALNTLSHRGPDQQNSFQDKNIFIGHRRLSILDLSENGKQPMLSENTVITANGEIYNYQKLKQILSAKHHFKSESDSEILLFGYEEWGIKELLHNIDGMYSFVIYDKIKQKLFIARDRYGIKPLYYSQINGQLAWSSELKALETYFNKDDLKIDYTAVYDYLTYLYIPTPKTLYENIFKLPPAHVLTFDLKTKELTIEKYWTLNTSENPIGIDKACEKIKSLVNESVKEQMISDVPIGFFLSGGIDSSIIVSTASNFSKKINTYSIGFEIEEHDETKYAEIIANKFKTNHSAKILNSTGANELINNIKTWYDEPFADTSALPSYLISKFAKQNSTVVLTGDGGDELFGGYDWYERFFNYKKKRNILFTVLKPFATFFKGKNPFSFMGRICNQIVYRGCDDIELYVKLLGGLLKHEKSKYRKLWNIPANYNDYWYFEPYFNSQINSKKQLQYLDFQTYLHEDIFTKVDRVSMNVSLECRVPFMKKELVEFAFSLPESIVYYNNQLKGILKETYKSVLPAEILHRKKRGFNIPLKQWNKAFLGNSLTQQEKLLKIFLNK